MSTTAEESEQPAIEVSEAASDEALALLEQESLDTDTAGLRLFVQQGGCAGLRGGGFDIANPNVVSECGCGESFRT